MITPSYKSISWTAVVTGVFSCIVCVLLLINFAGQPTTLPLETPDYLALKQRLLADPQNVDAQHQLRRLDMQLRDDFFHRQTFARRGAYLLFGGVLATLLLWQWAFTVQRQLPEPMTSDVAPETESNRWSQWACGATIALVVILTFSWRAFFPSTLPNSVAELNIAHVGSSSTDLESVPTSDASLPDVPDQDDETVKLPTPEQVAANWHRFRGPHGAGVSAFTDVPETWDGNTGDGVLWKVAVDLPGLSSPIVWDKRVFLTGATEEKREVYCFDVDTGELLWKSAVETDVQHEEELKVESSTGYAAPTPTTDGQRVYAIFANGDLAAYDFDGNLVWAQNLGLPENHYGHASSLTTHRDLLIVQLDQGSDDDDKSKLLAIRGATGETVWETPRKLAMSWSTPIVVEHEGKARVITCAEPWVIAYSADDGSEIWRANCLDGEVGPSPVYEAGITYVANDNAAVVAIRDGGKGDVTETHIAWSAEYALPDICSPLVTDQYVLLAASYGALASYDRETGGEEPIWEEEAEIMQSSPSLAGDRIYLINEEGKGRIATANADGLEYIAENDLGEACSTSPAFQPGRIYIRGETHLFCLGSEN